MIQFGYWKIRGLGGAARLILAYCGEEYTERLYDFKRVDGAHAGSYAEWDPSDWFDEKNSHHFQETFAFPNLPYLIDGDVKLTQSTAIVKYLARKHKIGNDIPFEMQTRMDLIEHQLRDDHYELCYLIYEVYGKKIEDKPEFVVKLTEALSRYDKLMTGHDFVAGSTLTYLDFMLWEVLDHFRLFEPSVFDGMDNLNAYMTRFRTLPQVAAYLNSEMFNKFPCYNRMAKWRGLPDNYADDLPSRYSSLKN